MSSTNEPKSGTRSTEAPKAADVAAGAKGDAKAGQAGGAVLDGGLSTAEPGGGIADSGSISDMGPRDAASSFDAGRTLLPGRTTLADAEAPASGSAKRMLPRGAGNDGWNVVPGWSAENYPTLALELRRTIIVVPSGDSGFSFGRAFGIRQGASDDDPSLDIIEVRNRNSRARCNIEAVVSWPDNEGSWWGGFTERVYGSVRVKGTDAPVSNCLAPQELGYFIIREDAEIARNPNITSVHLALKSEEADGYQAPTYRLVPADFVVNTVHFVNTGSASAPIGYANRIVQLILAKDGLPLGASAGAAGYGIHGIATVAPGEDVAYEMTMLIPRIVGDADRMLLLIGEY